MNAMTSAGPNPSIRPKADVSAAPQRASAARRKSVLLHPAAKPLLFALCLLPLVWLFYGAWANMLGANPAEALIRSTGDWTLRFLCITLAVTPLRQWVDAPALARFRRMLGLFTFFYVVMHFLSYGWLDQGFDVDAIVKDIAKRPFILVGTSGLLLMAPLAATSFNRAIKAMGAARWQMLHRAIYAIALLGLLHFFWMRAAKNNFAEVAVYAVVIAVLLGWRVKRWNSQRSLSARS
ncbi:MAG: protein-methionine-sulfoxide reductase heme-binding subunit MsrQ [Burkholderiaceae bacterium]|nr:protein-methionine-sulfoxide reductase heme-binding subunit MsrQ [Burkholderiaceae bacterium]